MKIRLDALLVEKGLVTGRDKAKALIMSGIVYVDGQKSTKAGTEVLESSNVEVRGQQLPYVSRGGLKLEKAINFFEILLDKLICMDIGASTGGFTDCMLQNGAKKVYAVDVGYGQLAWELRQNPQVVVMERTNIRHVTAEDIADPIDFVSIDVSFISLGLVLPVAHMLLMEKGKLVCLIKPQFEAGRDKVGKKGVVREKSTHIEVIEKVFGIAEKLKFSVLGLNYSPITGPEGNIEYLMFLEKSDKGNIVSLKDISSVVDSAHLAHNKIL